MMENCLVTATINYIVRKLNLKIKNKNKKSMKKKWILQIMGQNK